MKIIIYAKKLTPVFIILLSGAIFAFQTATAIETIAFHNDIFSENCTVVIDAGHGGEDGGAVGINGVLEKEINLSIALKLQKLFKSSNFNVIMIRDGDYSVGDSSLSTVAERKRSDTKYRLNIVNENKECIYIGIHQNYFTESKYSGAQIFYSPNNSESNALAESIRRSIVERLQPENKRENKVAEKNIYILYNAQTPAVFVECGFISNEQEAKKLCDEDYQLNMAESIYRGVLEYIKSCKNI